MTIVSFLNRIAVATGERISLPPVGFSEEDESESGEIFSLCHKGNE